VAVEDATETMTLVAEDSVVAETEADLDGSETVVLEESAIEDLEEGTTTVVLAVKLTLRQSETALLHTKNLAVKTSFN
jgi:hypothetical protein